MNVGDFGYFDFKLSEIKRIEDGKITEVSDGYFDTGGRNLSYSWFPISLRIKNVSDIFYDFSQKIHRSNFNSLNYPDIHRYLVNQWIKICNNIDIDNEKCKKVIDETENFVENVLKFCDSIKQYSINGVKIFRH